MKIEVILNNNDLSDELFEAPIDTISVGSVGCFYKMCSLKAVKDISHKCSYHQKKIKIIIPVTYQSHFNETVDYINHLIDNIDNFMLSVHDWGILYLLKDYKEKLQQKNISVSIGKGIVYSYLENPWLPEILQEESPEVRNKLEAGYNLSPLMTAGKLIDWNVSEIELSYLPGLIKAARDLSKYFSLNCFIDYIPISFSRSCHITRFKNITPGDNCSFECMKPYMLKISYSADIPGVPLINEVGEETLRLVPEYYSFGTEVYYKSNHDINPYDMADVFSTCSFDARFYSNIKDLKDRISAFADSFKFKMAGAVNEPET